MQLLARRLDSLLEPIPNPLVETIFAMDGEGPVSMPFLVKSFLMVLYYLLSSLMYDLVGMV